MDSFPVPINPERVSIDSKPKYQQRSHPIPMRDEFLREQQLRIEREAAAMGLRIEDLR